jgi:Uncharacterized conserved protein
MNLSSWKKLLKENIEDKYYLQELLGYGGFGGVYLADEVIDDNVTRQLAVKLIQADDDSETRKKQLEELRHAVNLKHPNLVVSFAPGLCQIKGDRFFYLLMELADETLQKRLIQSPLPVPQVREIVLAIASALVYLHKEPDRRVHRDLKPANVLRVGSSWELADFGLMRIIGNEGFHRTVELKGTREYVPPEAYQTKDITIDWDIWSLGVMTAEMLTGELPFTGETAALLMNQVTYDPPSIDWSKIPVPFVEIITGCLEKNLEKRWTAQKVLDKLTPPPPPTFTFETVTVNRQGEIIQRQTKQARYFTEDLENGVTLDMVYIPGGSFLMGASSYLVKQDGLPFLSDMFFGFSKNETEDEEGNSDNEKPQHLVTIKPFLMGKYTVTQAQWKAVTKFPKLQRELDPDCSYCKGDNLPVDNVSWHDAVEFCARLSQKTGRNYRLPSEAEWEYACRAATTTPFYFGETITTDLVNYNDNYTYGSSQKGIYPEKTTVVGSFPPNAFGLYDMHGNVYEWCADPWHENYNSAPTDGSVWESGGNTQYRVIRGGSWYYNPWDCRSVFRFWVVPVARNWSFGFRVVSSLAG